MTLAGAVLLVKTIALVPEDEAGSQQNLVRNILTLKLPKPRPVWQFVLDEPCRRIGPAKANWAGIPGRRTGPVTLLIGPTNRSKEPG